MKLLAYIGVVALICGLINGAAALTRQTESEHERGASWSDARRIKKDVLSEQLGLVNREIVDNKLVETFGPLIEWVDVSHYQVDFVQQSIDQYHKNALERLRYLAVKVEVAKLTKQRFVKNPLASAGTNCGILKDNQGALYAEAKAAVEKIFEPLDKVVTALDGAERIKDIDSAVLAFRDANQLSKGVSNMMPANISSFEVGAALIPVAP